MPEGSFVAKAIGSVLSAALAGLPWLTAASTNLFGSTLATFFSVCGAVCGPIGYLIYRRYLEILAAGGFVKSSSGRQAYDALRESLSGGNLAARLYSRRLANLLDRADIFFGDSNAAHHTLFPHAFGLKNAAPLWTAEALDRCVLISFIYPVATIFLIWVLTGQVGPAEAALHLEHNVPSRIRWTALVAVAIAAFCVWQFVTNRTRSKFWFWILATLAAQGSVHYILGGTMGAACAMMVANALIVFQFFRGALVIATAIVFMVSIGVLLGNIEGILPHFEQLPIMLLAFGGLILLTMLGTILLVLASLSKFDKWASAKHREIVFLAGLLLVLALLCLCAARWLASGFFWEHLGPALLFLGLLTVTNAPFDWFAVGLTRALLRRGLELGGWWPYLLAVADAIFAAVIVSILAITMVVVVQGFDELAHRGGGDPILPLDSLFAGLSAHPTRVEYWWIYLILLSTILPSLINLGLGGASLLRGVPGLSSLVLGFMPAGRAVATFDRKWIALVLTVQVFVGGALGILAQAVLIVVFIGYLMPLVGFGLLDIARDVATANYPLRIGQLLSWFF